MDFRNTPSGASEPASEPKETHGSAICFLTLSSDIRKKIEPIDDVGLDEQVERGVDPVLAAHLRDLGERLARQRLHRVRPEPHEQDALGRAGQEAEVLPVLPGLPHLRGDLAPASRDPGGA